MRTSKQAASKLLHTLEQRGFVERNPAPADARMKSVVLTAEGRALLAAVEHIYTDLEADWAETLGPETLRTIRTSLTRALVKAYGGTLPAVGSS